MIKLIFLLIYNSIRFSFLKVVKYNQFNARIMQRISPGCHIKLYNKGKILLGNNLNLESGVDIQVHGKGYLEIGNRTYMNHGCMISTHCEIKIGEGCMFGPGVKLFDNNHRFSAEKGVLTELTTAPIKIGNNCWLASDVIVLKGVNIGDNCVIGAGCVITQDIQEGSIVKNRQTLSIEKINN